MVIVIKDIRYIAVVDIIINLVRSQRLGPIIPAKGGHLVPHGLNLLLRAGWLITLGVLQSSDRDHF